MGGVLGWDEEDVLQAGFSCWGSSWAVARAVAGWKVGLGKVLEGPLAGFVGAGQLSSS